MFASFELAPFIISLVRLVIKIEIALHQTDFDVAPRIPCSKIRFACHCKIKTLISEQPLSEKHHGILSIKSQSWTTAWFASFSRGDELHKLRLCHLRICGWYVGRQLLQLPDKRRNGAWKTRFQTVLGETLGDKRGASISARGVSIAYRDPRSHLDPKSLAAGNVKSDFSRWVIGKLDSKLSFIKGFSGLPEMAPLKSCFYFKNVENGFWRSIHQIYVTKGSVRDAGYYFIFLNYLLMMTSFLPHAGPPKKSSEKLAK